MTDEGKLPPNTFPMLDGEKELVTSESDDEGGPESVDFDNVLKAIGQSTVYQVLTSVTITWFIIPYGMAILGFVFIGYEPHHVCTKINETSLLSQHSLLNDTTAEVIYETCQIRVTSNKTGSPENVALAPCTEGHDFVGGKQLSLKTEWGLVCEKRGMAELILTMMSLGMAIGSLAVNPLADKFGRKKILMICSAASIVFELLVTFSPNITAAIIFKTISGIFIQNLSTVSNTFGQERIPTKKREIFGIGIVINWTIGIMIFGSVAYGIQNYSWRYLQVFAALSGIPPFLSLFFIDESIAWLLAEGEHARALDIIEKKCQQFGTSFNAARNAYNQCVLRAKKSKENKDKSAVAKYGFTDIFRHRNILVTTMVLALTYFTFNTTYYGLYLTGATFNVNRYLMFIILAATELPSSILCFILIKQIGRRKIIITFLSMTFICLLISTLLVGLGSPSSQHVKNASTAFFILGKFGINLSYTCVFAFTAEFFPTTLRNIGFGICIFAARVGGMLAPFLFPLYMVVNWAPGTLLTVLCFFTIIALPLLPETKGKELPTTIEAFEALFRKETNCKQDKKRTCGKNKMIYKGNSCNTEMECFEAFLF